MQSLKIIAGAACMLTAASLLYFWNVPKDSMAPVMSAVNPPTQAPASTPTSQIEPDVPRSEATANSAAIPAPDPKSELRREATRAAKHFAETIRSPKRSALQKELMDDIMSNPAKEKLFLEALHSGKAAVETFNDAQAEARVLAQMILKRRAMDGDLTPLRDHIHRLRDELIAGKDLPKASEKDFVDMIANYADVRGAPAISADASAFLTEIGFRPDLARHYRRAIFLSLNGEISEERYRELFASLYSSTENQHAN